jgi:hypothetical protein
MSCALQRVACIVGAVVFLAPGAALAGWDAQGTPESQDSAVKPSSSVAGRRGLMGIGASLALAFAAIVRRVGRVR